MRYKCKHCGEILFATGTPNDIEGVSLTHTEYNDLPKEVKVELEKYKEKHDTGVFILDRHIALSERAFRHILVEKELGEVSAKCLKCNKVSVYNSIIE